MTPPRLLIFDLDGTLIDSAPDLHNSVNQLLQELGRAPLPLAQVRSMIGDGAGMLVQRALAAGPPVPIDQDAALARFLAIYAIDPTAATVPYPGVPDALEKLSRRGVPMIVSTNKPAEPSRVILAALGLDRYFGEVIGGDTFSFRKPDPRMVTDPIGRAGIDPAEAVLIGDSEIDAATAEAAGIRFILMTYGYHRGAIETIPCIAALDRFAEIEGVLFDPTA